MQGNAATSQILRLNQELMSISSKHNELIRNVEIVEKEKATVAAENKYLLDANKDLSSKLNKLKEEHSQLISRCEMLNSVIATITEKSKTLVGKQLSDLKQKLEQVSAKYKLIGALKIRFLVHQLPLHFFRQRKMLNCVNRN